jgi:hypothetical protein
VLAQEIAAGRIRRGGGFPLVPDAFPPDVLAALRTLVPGDGDYSAALNGGKQRKRWAAGREAAAWFDHVDVDAGVLRVRGSMLPDGTVKRRRRRPASGT